MTAREMMESRRNRMKKIEKKVLPEYYKEIRSHRKMFELRKDDSDYEVGDILILREWDGEKYTGCLTSFEITYILRNCPEYGLMDGYCILSLQTPWWDSIIRSPIVTLEGGGEMKIERMTEIETSDIEVGDRIHVDHYTATCQEITQKGALFLMDQYLDEPMAMNRNNSNQGGYEKSDLREALQSEDVLKLFSGIREWMVPFDNGDLLRIPFFSEIFGQEDAEYFETDGCEQWPLMEDKKNRIALRRNSLELGWLQNKLKGSSTRFCSGSASGRAGSWSASLSFGVRLTFLITTCSKTREEADDETD